MLHLRILLGFWILQSILLQNTCWVANDELQEGVHWSEMGYVYSKCLCLHCTLHFTAVSSILWSYLRYFSAQDQKKKKKLTALQIYIYIYIYILYITIKLFPSLIKCSMSCEIEWFNWIMVKIQLSFKYSEFHVNYFTIFSFIITLSTDVTKS